MKNDETEAPTRLKFSTRVSRICAYMLENFIDVPTIKACYCFIVIEYCLDGLYVSFFIFQALIACIYM